MKSLRYPLTMILMLISLLSLGCGLSLGPQTKTEYVLIHPGKPLEVLENKTVLGRVLDGSGSPVKQEIGGWVMMPPDHWLVVKRALDEKKK